MMITPNLKNLLKMYETAYKANNIAAIDHCAGQLSRIKEQLNGKEHNPVVSKYMSRLHKVHEDSQGIKTNTSSRR
jgi:hypothetical protein